MTFFIGDELFRFNLGSPRLEKTNTDYTAAPAVGVKLDDILRLNGFSSSMKPGTCEQTKTALPPACTHAYIEALLKYFGHRCVRVLQVREAEEARGREKARREAEAKKHAKTRVLMSSLFDKANINKVQKIF